MREWLRGIIARTKKFDMFGSIWFANLDCMVDNIQYLQDDDRQCEQCGKSGESDKPIKSKQCDKSASHTCTHCGAGISNGTGYDCYCNYPINRNSKHFSSNRKKRGSWNDVCTKPRYKYYDDVGYRESTRNPKG